MKIPFRALVSLSLAGLSAVLVADTLPPELASFDVSPASVDVSSGAVTVQVTLHVTDDDSGFAYANVYLYNASGAFVDNFFVQASDVESGGDSLNGIYVVDVIVPEFGLDGNWKLEASFNDENGNQSEYGGTGTPLPGPGSEIIDVTNTGIEDTADPQLASISVSPGTVDVTSADQTITVTLNATDALSGLNYGVGYLFKPGDVDSGVSHYFPASSGVGTPQDAVYTYTMTIPRGSEAGDWVIRTSLRDLVGNSDYLFGTPDSTFTVVNNGSVATGNLGDACDATQYTWSSSSSEAWFFQTATTLDGIDAARSGPIDHGGSTDMEMNVTGPGTLTFWWKVESESEFDQLSVYASGSGDSDSISGTPEWAEVTLTIDPGPQTVTWTYSKDSSASYGEDAGWVDRVYFAADSDSELPTLQYIGISPDPASVASGQVDVTVTLEISDDSNGVSGGYVDLYDASGNNVGTESFYSYDVISGDEFFGTYELTFTVYQSDLDPLGPYFPGTWRAEVTVDEDYSFSSRTYGPGYDDFPNPGDELFSVTDGSSGQLGLASVDSFTPDPADVTAASQTVTLDFTLDDPGNEFGYGYIYVFDGDDRYVDSFFFDSASGSGNQYSVDLEIPRYAHPGAWRVEFSLYDLSDNETYEAGALGFDVTNTGIVDDAPPVISSISITPGTLDTSAAPGNLSVTVDVTDDLSGMDYCYLEFIDPLGNEVNSLAIFVDSSEIVGGTFTVNPVIPQGSMAGVWRCEIATKDLAGNFHRYGTGPLETPFPVPADAEFTVGTVSDSTFVAFAGGYSLAGPDALPSANPDSDWANNGLELLLGLNPTVADAPDPALYQVSRVGNELRLDFKVAAGLTVTDNGDFLDIRNAGGSPPFQVTGQTGSLPSGPWINTRPLPVGGGIYRVTLPLGAGDAGFCRLMFVDP